MIFTELQFWVFFAVVAGLYVVLPHRAQNRMLLVASYVFYGAWDWRFLSLILLSTAVDYLVGLRLAETQDDHRRRRLLQISLAVNLGMLGIFKYLGFFAEGFQELLALAGLSPAPCSSATTSLTSPRPSTSIHATHQASSATPLPARDRPHVRRTPARGLGA